MNQLLQWIDQRTGWVEFWRTWLNRPVPGAPAWRFVWPSTIVFTFLMQAITGIVVWMYYSPSAQTAWESVYYLQYQVQNGWLIRAMHHYAGQAMLVLVGIYLVQMIVCGTYRAPREFLFWCVVLMGLITLALNLTGDLLPWDQNSFWSTRVRTGFLTMIPGIGNSLFKLAAGGTAFGHLTLTRFLALHVGVFSSIFAGLIFAHAWLSGQHGMERTPYELPTEGYWPRQAGRDAIACLVVLAVVLAMSYHISPATGEAGVALGAPANPVEDPGTARPEWSFRGLFQFRELFPTELEILPIFVLSGAAVLVVLLMPFIYKVPGGYWINIAFIVVVLGGLAVLSRQSYSHDAANEKYQQDVAAGNKQAERAKELAGSEMKIPVGGALAMLRNDAKTQGPKLFARYCVSCHDFSDPADGSLRNLAPTAPDLAHFASRPWLAGLLDPKQIATPKYFGNTKFKKSDMTSFVKETAAEFDKKDVELAVAALSAEAGLRSQLEADTLDAPRIAKGRELISGDFGCTDCHTFRGKGGMPKGPDLTGYGSRTWLMGIVSNPAHKRFYGKNNDRMPAYADSTDPAKNTLSDRDLGLLVDWLRGDWYVSPAEE